MSHIVVLGLGLSGWSSIRFLHKKYQVIAMDSRESPPFGGEALSLLGADSVVLGELNLEQCLAANWVVISPGISIFDDFYQLLVSHGVKIVTDVELFFDRASAPVIGVTGTNGKSTLVSLLAHVANHIGVEVVAGGNLGEPCLDLLKDSVSLYILELSSYQLAHSGHLPLEIGVLLNIADDHLQWHQTFEHYRQSKYRIFGDAKQVLIAGQCIEEAPQKNAIYKDLLAQDQVCQYHQSRDEDSYILNGFEEVRFNREESLAVLDSEVVAMVLSIVKVMGWSINRAMSAISTFPGLVHRCQILGDYSGVRWINDSKATNGHAVYFACKRLGSIYPGKLVLILGGEPKGWGQISLNGLADLFKQIIVVGGSGGWLRQIPEGVNFVECSTVGEAVGLAKELAVPEDCVLFSPGGASFDQYLNFAERGEDFIHHVCG